MGKRKKILFKKRRIKIKSATTGTVLFEAAWNRMSIDDLAKFTQWIENTWPTAIMTSSWIEDKKP